MGGGHIDVIVSDVDHPGFKFSRATNDDNTRASLGHQY